MSSFLFFFGHVLLVFLRRHQAIKLREITGGELDEPALAEGVFIDHLGGAGQLLVDFGDLPAQGHVGISSSLDRLHSGEDLGLLEGIAYLRQLDVDDFRKDDFKIAGVSKMQLAGRTLSLHVTGNHDGVLKALSRYKITKLLAEEYSLDNLFLEYYQNGNENDK